MPSQNLNMAQLAQWIGTIEERLSDLAPVTRLMAPVAAGEVKQRFGEQRSPDGTAWLPLRNRRPRGGNLALMDTGKLRASISGRAEGTDSIVVGTNIQYAAIHQFGGIIRPRRGRMLAIPLTVEAQRAGSPRRFQRPLSPRVRGNRGVLVEQTPGGRGRAHYALVRQVTIPARPFLGFSPAFVEKLESLALIYVIEGQL